MTRTRAKPQHLLVTLLGDYWKGREERISSAALVRLLAEFGIGPVGARSALSRLATRGLLARSQRGRNTFYGLTDHAQRVLEEGARRIFGFGAGESHWSGAWSIVAFSVAEADRDLRHVLRSRLRWLGFAPLYPGLWVSPRRDIEPVARALEELGVRSATLFRGEAVPWRGEGAGPLEAWNLADLRVRYEGFLSRFAKKRERLLAGTITPREALVERTRLMDAWREFPREDPDLPAEFLPRDWPRRAARELFLELHDGLGTMAERRVKEIVAENGGVSA
jgi:phenylacetic acid degradation operon negative regulatory protein